MEPADNISDVQIHDLPLVESQLGYDQEFYTTNWLKPAFGPHSEDLNAKRMAFHAGPCWLKILVADRVAGSIIGKGGKVITEIETSSGCIMKLSPGMCLVCLTGLCIRSNLFSRDTGAHCGYCRNHGRNFAGSEGYFG